MNDLTTLHRAILLDPADDLARMAFADELEATGAGEHADFIRIQCGVMPNDQPYGKGFCPCCGCWEQSRGWALLHNQTDRPSGWARTLPEVLHRIMVGFDGDRPTHAFRWRGGFLHSVSLPLADFMEHAPALFAAHPIEFVTLTDRRPVCFPVRMEYAWHSNPSLDETSQCHWQLTYDLWALLGACRVKGTHKNLKVYTSEKRALDALSAACVRYGRSLVGLPALRKRGVRR